MVRFYRFILFAYTHQNSRCCALERAGCSLHTHLKLRFLFFFLSFFLNAFFGVFFWLSKKEVLPFRCSSLKIMDDFESLKIRLVHPSISTSKYASLSGALNYQYQ